MPQNIPLLRQTGSLLKFHSNSYILQVFLQNYMVCLTIVQNYQIMLVQQEREWRHKGHAEQVVGMKDILTDQISLLHDQHNVIHGDNLEYKSRGIEQLHPMILFRIGQFLKIDQICKLRLTSRRLDHKIKQSFIYHCQFISQYLEILEPQLTGTDKPSAEEIEEEKLEILTALSQMQPIAIAEIQCLHWPPKVVQDMYSVLYSLFHPDVRLEDITFQKIRVLLVTPNLFNQIQTINLDTVSEISRTYLSSLINQYPEQQVSKMSMFCGYFFRYFQCIEKYQNQQFFILSREIARLRQQLGVCQRINQVYQQQLE